MSEQFKWREPPYKIVRALVDKIHLPQERIAELVGTKPTTFRRYLMDPDNSTSATAAPKPVIKLLRILADTKLAGQVFGPDILREMDDYRGTPKRGRPKQWEKDLNPLTGLPIHPGLLGGEGKTRKPTNHAACDWMIFTDSSPADHTYREIAELTRDWLALIRSGILDPDYDEHVVTWLVTHELEPAPMFDPDLVERKRFEHEHDKRKEEHEAANGLELEKAVSFLQEELADGPVLTNELQKRAEEKGLHWRMVQRAKAVLQAEAVKRSDGRWEWHLDYAPDHEPFSEQHEPPTPVDEPTTIDPQEWTDYVDAVAVDAIPLERKLELNRDWVEFRTHLDHPLTGEDIDQWLADHGLSDPAASAD